MSSTPQNPQTPQPPQQSQVGEILYQIHRYTDIATQAVLQAQQEGVGLDGATKSQMALGFVHTGLQTAGLIVPGMAAAATAERQLEPIMIPLFTALVNMFRAHGHPAFQQPAQQTPPATPTGR